MKQTTYGPGGYDPTKPNGNVVGEREIALPEDAADVAQQKFRDAVAAATTLAALKAAILGTDTNVEPEVRPR